MFLWLLALCFTLYCLQRWLKNCQFDTIPGPPGIFLFENALDFLMDSVELFNYTRSLACQYKDIFKVKFGPKKFIAIYNPKDVEVVISGKKHNQKGFLYRFIKPLVGDGIISSIGEKWERRRKILSSSFHYNILQGFASIIQDSSRNLAEKLRPELNKTKTAILPFVNELALKTVCETTMRVKLDEKVSFSEHSYKNAICNVASCFVYRIQRIWMHPDFIYRYTEIGRRQDFFLKSITLFRDQVINERRKNIGLRKTTFDSKQSDDDTYMSAKKKKAMLDLLLEDEKEGIIDVKGIEEEVDNFIFADKVLEECFKVLDDTQNITIAELAQLKYTESCIKEAMRLFPPVGLINRILKEDTVLSEYNIPAGTECIILIYDMHRRSDLFPEPLKFLPERFLADKPTWHPYAYIPFSAGPRNCLGQKFAMMEMKMVLATVLPQYVLKPVTKPEDVVLQMDIVLRSKNPIYVKFEQRL